MANSFAHYSNKICYLGIETMAVETVNHLDLTVIEWKEIVTVIGITDIPSKEIEMQTAARIETKKKVEKMIEDQIETEVINVIENGQKDQAELIVSREVDPDLQIQVLAINTKKVKRKRKRKVTNLM